MSDTAKFRLTEQTRQITHATDRINDNWSGTGFNRSTSVVAGSVGETLPVLAGMTREC